VTIVVSPEAREDIDQLYAYLARDSPAAADHILARIIEVLDLLASGQFEGRRVTLRDGQIVHGWAVPPYRVYYRKIADEFQVVRVYHQARRPIEKP